MPMRLSATLFQSLMSSPLRTTRQSLPDPTPATPTSVFAPWPSASEMSCGPKAVSWMSPETSAVRASANRWNITVSIWMLYLAASSGSSQSGESAGTLSMPCLMLDRLRQRRAQIGLRERVSGGKRRNTSEHQTAYRFHDSSPPPDRIGALARFLPEFDDSRWTFVGLQPRAAIVRRYSLPRMRSLC